jgi:hypothetical protein
MRAFFLCLSILIIISAVGFGQEKIDVVYLKNGDVRKGTIIENTPNEYVKIETSDGSIFTIKYADIQKMTKETASEVKSSAAIKDLPKGLMARSGDFGITGAVWLSGDFTGDANGITKTTGVLARVFYDAYVVDKFCLGVYVNLAPLGFEGTDETATAYEFGGALKGRFPLGDGSAAMKIGVGIGYRNISSKFAAADKIKAMGLNATVEIQFNAKGIVPFVEVGFLSQPTGGNVDYSVTFPPIIYFGGGVAF